MKELKIGNGTFCFGDKLVSSWGLDILDLKIAEIDIEVLREAQENLQHIHKENNYQISELSLEQLTKLTKTKEVIDKELKKVFEKAPTEANAYVIGEDYYKRPRSGFYSFVVEDSYYHPILYLKIED